MPPRATTLSPTATRSRRCSFMLPCNARKQTTAILQSNDPNHRRHSSSAKSSSLSSLSASAVASPSPAATAASSFPFSSKPLIQIDTAEIFWKPRRTSLGCPKFPGESP